MFGNSSSGGQNSMMGNISNTAGNASSDIFQNAMYGGWNNLFNGKGFQGFLAPGSEGGMSSVLDPGNFFGPPPNPADAAMPYLNQIQGAIQPNYQPYMNAGGATLQPMLNTYGSIFNNPGQAVNQMGSNFQQSPGYQFQTQQGMNAVNQAAAAGGMLGSPQHQQQAAGMVNNLANQDYYNYLDHAMSMFGQGSQGMQNLGNMGLNAATNYSDSLTNALMTQAQLAYAGQADQNQGRYGILGDALGAMGGSGGGAAIASMF